MCGSIDKFENELSIRLNLTGGDNPLTRTYKLSAISFYSLESRQKWSVISVCALAIIALTIGASSLGGAPIMSPTAAWVMVGTGTTVTVSLLGGAVINHLMFVKQVGKFLDSLPEDIRTQFEEGSNYPGCDLIASIQTPASIFAYSFESQIIYGRCNGESACSGMHKYFYISFHRTESIHQERIEA